MKYALAHFDTCRSDYFRGSHLPVIQVLVDENTTYMDIKLALLNHYDSVDHIEDIDLAAYDEAVHELFAGVTYSLESVPLNLQLVGSMAEDEEWDLYMYFILQEVSEDDE